MIILNDGFYERSLGTYCSPTDHTDTLSIRLIWYDLSVLFICWW